MAIVAMAFAGCASSSLGIGHAQANMQPAGPQSSPLPTTVRQIHAVHGSFVIAHDLGGGACAPNIHPSIEDGEEQGFEIQLDRPNELHLNFTWRSPTPLPQTLQFHVIGGRSEIARVNGTSPVSLRLDHDALKDLPVIYVLALADACSNDGVYVSAVVHQSVTVAGNWTS